MHRNPGRTSSLIDPDERLLCANRGHSSSGHSLKDFEAILDAHYLGRDVQLAEGRQSAISINTGW